MEKRVDAGVVCVIVMAKKYFDLIEKSPILSGLTIKRKDNFECEIVDDNGQVYCGFLLGKSEGRNVYTICDVSFHKSGTDNRYQPRLIFKRVNKDFEEKNVPGKSLTQRISFKTGSDGYREFWEMIGFLHGFKELVDIDSFKQDYRIVTDEEFSKYLKFKENEGRLEVFEKLVAKSNVDAVSIMQSASTKKMLEEYRDKINEFTDQEVNETCVQDWIDFDDHKNRQQRCMIFGLEFINHKREGGVSGNRYDLLTRIGTEAKERVLIELKSPADSVFDIKKNKNINDSKDEYQLSDSLARAIPQILEYKSILEGKDESDPELQGVGEKNKISISKCIIVIGARDKNPRWERALRDLRNSLNSNLEIWTYTDLYNKIDSTITNLEHEYES